MKLMRSSVYKIEIDKRAEKELSRIEKNDRVRILDTILNLSSNPRPSGYKKLVNRPAYRIRVGNFRIIYSVNDKRLIVMIIKIVNRKDIYA
jgi:mRNA interferase RelE/StbE